MVQEGAHNLIQFGPHGSESHVGRNANPSVFTSFHRDEQDLKRNRRKGYAGTGAGFEEPTSSRICLAFQICHMGRRRADQRICTLETRTEWASWRCGLAI